MTRLYGAHAGRPQASVWVDGESVRAAALGIKVEKTAAVAATGGSTDLFSITGGAIYLIDLVGIVETDLVANTDLDMAFDPDDGGSDVVLGTALVADSDVTGTMYALNTTFGGVLIATLDADQLGLLSGKVIRIADSGDIKLNSTGGGAGGGLIHWYLTYLPIETGAAVAAS